MTLYARHDSPVAGSAEDPRLAARSQGVELVGMLSHPSLQGCTVRWTAELRDGSNYIRQSVGIRQAAPSNDAPPSQRDATPPPSQRNATPTVSEVAVLISRFARFAARPPSWAVTDQPNIPSTSDNSVTPLATENLLEDTDGLLRLSTGGRRAKQLVSDLTGTASVVSCFLLTCVLLMTSSHSQVHRWTVESPR